MYLNKKQILSCFKSEIYCGIWMPINNGWMTQTCNLQPGKKKGCLKLRGCYHTSLFSSVANWNVFTINGGLYDKWTHTIWNQVLASITAINISFAYDSHVKTLWNTLELWEVCLRPEWSNSPFRATVPRWKTCWNWLCFPRPSWFQLGTSISASDRENLGWIPLWTNGCVSQIKRSVVINMMYIVMYSYKHKYCIYTT